MLDRCRRTGIRVSFSGLQEEPPTILAEMGIREDGVHLRFARDFAEAVQWASGEPGERVETTGR